MSRWNNPLRDLVLMQERMNRLLEDSMRRAPEAPVDVPESAWTPEADVFERDGEIVLFVDVPGIDRQTVQLQLDEHVLTLRGERPLPPDVDPARARRSERAYGSFVRTFELPRDVDEERISAEQRNGVLMIRLPKRGEKRSRQVQITVE
jgi:HSP20 family protein